MKYSQSFIFTLKDAPADAEIESHKLLVRAGFIKKLTPGIYSLLPLAVRSLRKFETILREELARAGCVELLMPMVQPRELWEETNRWTIMGKGMARFKDRNGHEFCLGPTHEEVVTDIVRRDVKSYRHLPQNLYQIQTKFRDEIRPRFGLMRGKEFIMKDGYSFDANPDRARETYKVMFNAYNRIFKRCGLEFRSVRADAGAIGGSLTHEFQVLAQSGEDHIMACDNCTYASNIEITPAGGATATGVQTQNPAGLIAAQVPPMEKFATPGLKTIEDLAKSLRTDGNKLVKTMFYKVSEKKFIALLLRGNDEVNEIKIKNNLGLELPPEMAVEVDVKAITGAMPGSCGPVGLKIPVYVDFGVAEIADMVVGANQDDFHLKHVQLGRDFKPTGWGDFRKAVAGDTCPECKTGKLHSHRGIEVGHVFYLGTKYSKAMKAVFLDESGKEAPCEMGCYGIGVTRTIQAAVEQNHDKDGIIWPLSLAPLHVHLALLDVNDPKTRGVADDLYRKLLGAGIEVLYDDRDERPGVKFKDADLIGLPLRVNVGKRSVDEGQVELIERKGKLNTKVSVDHAFTRVEAWVREGLSKLQA